MTRSLPLLLVAVAHLSACGGCSDAAGSRNNDSSDAATVPDGSAPDGAQAPDASGADAGDVGACTPCGGACCSAAEECVEDACLAACGSGTRCGASCCEGADVCLYERCVTPGMPCEFTEDCAPDEYCEPALAACVPRDQVDLCEFIPPVGEFTPTTGCTWPGPAGPDVNPDSRYVVVAPIVGNLTDDNGDGVTNQDDVPDLVFLSRTDGCCNKRGTLRIVDGRCNADGTMRTIASLDGVAMANDAAPALGDLDGDGVPELVAIRGMNVQADDRLTPQGLVAWKRMTADGTSWAPLWENDTYPTWNVHSRGGAAVSIADLDADGAPEVIVGNVVLNGQDGTLRWDGLVTSAGAGGIGNNAFLGPSSSVGDVDLDGMQEVAAGNTLYAHDGTVRWTFDYPGENSPCGGNLPCDGFTAMANFDADPEGEIVIIRRGEAYVLNHDGTQLWRQPILKDDCANNESGPPTVADFDGDGRPEIGTAAADFYTVMDMDCDVDDWQARGCRARGVLWATPNNDCSSRVTASSVFDFEGDGKAEMVYADETNFRIFDGTTGAVLFDDPTHRSNTRLEMPIVADIDNDGNAEVVIPSATEQGIKVWQDAADNWVRTRRIWNQHAYSVTNVDEDGSIPTTPATNWANPRLNNFRQNIQPDDLFLAPNLVVEALEVAGLACGDDRSVSIRLTVRNAGSLGLGAGVPLRVTATSGGMTVVINDGVTTQPLLPGQTETFVLTWIVPADWLAAGFTIDALLDPDQGINECLEDDNAGAIDSADITFAGPDLVVDAVTADLTTCGTNGNVDLTVTVRNAGLRDVPVDVPVAIDAIWNNQVTPVTVVRTTMTLGPGAVETFAINWTAPPNARGRMVTFRATVDPAQEVYACDLQSSGETTGECRIVM